MQIAVAAGLDAMIDLKCDVAVISRLGCGAYSGPHYDQINKDFPGLIRNVLMQPCFRSSRCQQRKWFFEEVVVVDQI